jgi:hypothetical protein
MHVNELGKRAFLDYVRSETLEFLRRIDEPQAFVVKDFYPAAEILDFRTRVFESGLTSGPGWHPLLDGCPDYHRLHDDYPKAYVKQRLHAFYYHGWYRDNKPTFDYFNEIFVLKNFLAGLPRDAFLSNVPSDGFIARVNVHHYPRGGGYQAEHIDPVGQHAQIQTLIAASRFDKDYHQGGVYGRPGPHAEATYLDARLSPGDLLVMSPGIRHGVERIDPDVPYEWRSNDGRWMILPVIVGSDYPNANVTKPVEVTDDRGRGGPRGDHRTEPPR